MAVLLQPKGQRAVRVGRFCSVRWRPLLRYAVLAFAASFALSVILIFRSSDGFHDYKGPHYFDYLWQGMPGDVENRPLRINDNHRIKRLIKEARQSHEARLEEQPTSLAVAASLYRQRRGRHPPPGFDAWFRYAVSRDAFISESYFDRIYHDLAPFWALDANETVYRASSWHHVVRVRHGAASFTGDVKGRVPWMQLWTDLIAKAAPHLPDVDMPINMMDESRLLVPWENINQYVAEERKMRSIAPLGKVARDYTGLDAIDELSNSSTPYEPEWLIGDFWDIARDTCSPTAPSRLLNSPANFTQFPLFPDQALTHPDYAERGYVRNFTASMDACIQPWLRETHGTFVEPVSIKSTKELIPIFSGSKIHNMNNDILIPGAMYATDDPMYSGGKGHGPRWDRKITGTVWRGVASGGRNRAENWSHFHRHRLVEMLNATTVARMEREHTRAATFEMPPASIYNFPRRKKEQLAAWLNETANAGFTELLCHPRDDCSYVEPYLSPVPGMPMAEQYRFKFMPDVDGNSFSARFRGFLLSTSMPIKATIYAEWHDDRLQPWVHFVPMTNSFQDLYGILDFFTRDRAGDEAARRIAAQGRDWASRVLRKEDMMLYVWRLLLEFARICDDKREVLGYVDDLAPSKNTNTTWNGDKGHA